MVTETKNVVLFLQDLIEGYQPYDRTQLQSKITTIGERKYSAIWHDEPAMHLLCNEVEVIVASNHHLTPEMVEPYKKLKMISLAFTGYDDIYVKRKDWRDLDATYKERNGVGLAMYYVPEYSAQSVADLAVGLTLSIFREIPHWKAYTKAEMRTPPRYDPGYELAGKTVGILGIGRTGMESTKRFLAFGCTVVGWARSSRDEFEAAGGRFEKNLEVLLAKSDVLVLHLPLTSDTREIINTDSICGMRKGVVLINVARGGLVNTHSLIDALRSGQIRGVGIDVFDMEPNIGPPELLAIESVLATPHIGFKTREAIERLADKTLENIGRFVGGDTTNRLILPE